MDSDRLLKNDYDKILVVLTKALKSESPIDSNSPVDIQRVATLVNAIAQCTSETKNIAQSSFFFKNWFAIFIFVFGVVACILSAVDGPSGNASIKIKSNFYKLIFKPNVSLDNKNIFFSHLILKKIDGIEKVIDSSSCETVSSQAMNSIISSGNFKVMSIKSENESYFEFLAISNSALAVNIVGGTSIEISGMTTNSQDNLPLASDEGKNFTIQNSQPITLLFKKDSHLDPFSNQALHIASFRASSFDVVLQQESGKDGIPTKPDNRLISSTISYLSYGNKTVQLGFGRPLTVHTTSGYSRIVFNTDCIEMDYTGIASFDFGKEFSKSSPTLLEWFIGNPIVVSLFTASIGLATLFGKILGPLWGFPKS